MVSTRRPEELTLPYRIYPRARASLLAPQVRPDDRSHVGMIDSGLISVSEIQNGNNTNENKLNPISTGPTDCTVGIVLSQLLPAMISIKASCIRHRSRSACSPDQEKELYPLSTRAFQTPGEFASHGGLPASWAQRHIDWARMGPVQPRARTGVIVVSPLAWCVLEADRAGSCHIASHHTMPLPLGIGDGFAGVIIQIDGRVIAILIRREGRSEDADDHVRQAPFGH